MPVKRHNSGLLLTPAPRGRRGRRLLFFGKGVSMFSLISSQHYSRRFAARTIAALLGLAAVFLFPACPSPGGGGGDYTPAPVRQEELTLPDWLNGIFQARLNNFTTPDFYDDSFEVNAPAKTFYHYGNSARTQYFGGTIINIITNAGTTADPHIMIVKITNNGGSWHLDPPARGKYHGVAFTDLGIYVTYNYAYKAGGMNTGAPTLAAAKAEFTKANGYYDNMNQYASYYPTTAKVTDLADFQGKWTLDIAPDMILSIAGIGIGYGYDDEDYDSQIPDGQVGQNDSMINIMGQIAGYTSTGAAKGVLYIYDQASDYGSGGYLVLAWNWINKAAGRIEWELLDNTYDYWTSLEAAKSAWPNANSVSFDTGGFTRQ